MKQKLTIIAFCLIGWSTLSHAQEEVTRDRPLTKDGKEILPEKGDIAIGIQADEFLSFAGNFFGKSNSNGSPSFDGFNNTIFLKKYISPNTAIRANISLSRSGNTRVYNDVQDDQAVNDILRTSQVQDAIASANYNNTIGIGLEKRRGYGRLQGFYGAGVSMNFGGNTNEYTYGNAMSAANPRPSSYAGQQNNRILKLTDSYFGIGANAFIGVEYFVARKISLQGELGWGINYNWQNDASTLYETVQSGERVEYTRNSGNDEFRSLDYRNNVSNSLGIFFHF